MIGAISSGTRSRIFAFEEQFPPGAGIAIGSVNHIDEDGCNRLLVEVISGEATSAFGREPMQVVSGPTGAPTVHFEAPLSNRVVAEIGLHLSPSIKSS